MANPQHYVYVVPEDNLPAGFICTVCHDVAGVHAACPGCSQTFCQSCVHRWFNTQKSNVQGCTCPYCRRKLRFSDLKHDADIQQQLDKLTVYCPNKSEGCRSIISRSAVAAHLNKDCAYQQCSCQFCGLQGLRADVKQHEEGSCSKRVVPCANAAVGCSAEVPLHLMPVHLEFVCDMQTKCCPQCSQAVPRKDWSRHLQTGCPARQYCPLRLYGCSYSGAAADVQEHKQSCSYLTYSQQLEQQLAGEGSSSTLAAATAALRAADPGELPSSCLIDEYSVFAASTLHSSAAAACQKLLNAVPAAAVPARLQRQLDLLDMVTKLEAQQKPAALAAQTPPKQINADVARPATAAAAAAATAPECPSDGADPGMTLPCGMSPAEALALGFPQCFRLLGLESHANLETAWRVALNLIMIDVLSSEAGEAAAPSSFMLYTTLCRAWNVLQPTAGGQQDKQQQQQGMAAAPTQLALARIQLEQRAFDTLNHNAGSSNSNRASQTSDRSSSSSAQVEHDTPETAEAGLERGLLEDEYEKMNEWIVEQHETMAAVAAAVGCVQQLWLSLGWMLLLPDHAKELEELAETVDNSLIIMSSIATPKKHTTSSRNSSRPSTQQQQERGSPASLVGPLEAAAAAPERRRSAPPALEAAVINSSEHAQQQQQQQQRPLWLQQISRVVPAAIGAMLGNPEVPANQQQQQGGEAPAAAGGSSSSSGRVSSDSEPAAGPSSSQTSNGVSGSSSGACGGNICDFSSALEQLNRLAETPASSKRRHKHAFLQNNSMLEALERCTSVLVLHHLRAEHVETSMIPQMPAQLMNGYRGVWGTSVLAVANRQLGPGFRLGWQSVAVLSDMVSGLIGRILQVIGEGFYDPAEGRVPLSPELALAAVKLVVPPRLLSACLERLSALSSRYHDEECDDLTEVTWQQLATRIDLTLELDKLVFLVDERLPVTVDEDEDDDMDGSDEGSDYDNNDEEEYTTDDEYDEVPVATTRPRARLHNTGAAAAAANDAASQSDADRDDEDSEGGWESADSDEVMELLGPEREHNQQQQQQQVAPTAGIGVGTTDNASGADIVPASQSDAAPAIIPESAAGAGAKSALSGATAAAASSDQQQQQQQQDNAEAGEAAAPAADAGGMDWQQEFAANLEQLAAASAYMNPLEQHILQRAVQSMDWLGVGVGQAFGSSEQGAADSTQGLGLESMQSGASEVPATAAQASDSGSSSRSAVAGAADGGQAAPIASGPQQQQRDREAKEKEAGDACTHGVVLIAGLVEFVLMQLLTGAAKAAAQHAAIAQAAAGGLWVLPGRINQQEQQQVNNHELYVSARHVLLAATDDEDLRSLIVDRPVDQQYHNPAAVARAGVLPHFSTALMPSPEQEPLTTWLMQLASGKLMQQQRESGSSYGCGSSGAVVFPADLRYYCGRKWEAPVPCVSAAQGCSAAGPSGGSDSSPRSTAYHTSAPAAVVCCYLSGWQCSNCAGATAALAAGDFGQQLKDAISSLQGIAAAPWNADSSSSGQKCGFSNEQWQQLKGVTRMYHLQQPWWYETTSSTSSTLSSKGSGLSSIDQVQLAHVQQHLAPLRDVVAIREVYLQQQEEGLVWPRHDFDAMVGDALDSVVREKQQQTALQKQLQRLVVKPAAGRSSAAAADHEATDDPGSCDMEVDDEALTLLATAAEDFLVQQFRSANEFALYAGREEMLPEDVRMALVTGGYKHMVPTAAEAGSRRGVDMVNADLKQLCGL